MKLKDVCFFLLPLFSLSLSAAEEYDVSKIDPALLAGASAVKRYELIRFEIKNPGSAVYYYKTAITILNENGEDHAEWQEGYDDKFTAILSVNATLYNAAGKKIRSLKKSDISDISGLSQGTLADNQRVKRHNFYYKAYPYTVEYEVEIRQNQLMFIPPWQPVEDEDFAVEKSIFEIISPADYTIRYKAYHYDKEPVITGNKEKVYHWEVSGLAAVKKEYACPEWGKITPTVLAGPTNFEIAGLRGDMSNWKEFGKFIYNLKQSRDKLPEGVKTAVHQLTDGETDVRKKIGILYNYLQQNTRYISVQLGIGGWQPFDAEYVAAKKYGDCKALTNYMFSLLKEAGIRSVYTMVKAGYNNRYIRDDFPAQQFNHVILSVPLQKDTMWLECTSQTLPAGYLSGFTSNRYALMVDENGGHLVKTLNYTSDDNKQVRKIDAAIDENGKLNADIVTEYSGLLQDELFEMINRNSKKEQLEYLKKNIELPNYDIRSFDYRTIKSAIPEIDEKLDVVAENYAQVSGKRMFILPDLLTKSSLKLKDEKRQYDIDLKFEYCYIDTVRITVPDGFIPESMPQAASLANEFGDFKINCSFDNNQIMMTRFFNRKAGHFSAGDYTILVKMYGEMYKADRGKIVLIKKG